MAPQTSTKLTYEDYAAIPDDGRRHEILDGEHYVNPAPSSYHQIVLTNLLVPLVLYAEEHQLGRVLPSPIGVVLADHDIVQPDIVFIRAERAHIVEHKYIVGAPDLAVEILSDSNRRYDVRIKYDRYQRGGVREYWIVDPDELGIRVFRRAGDKFQPAEVGDTITTPLLPGFALPLSRIFRM
jgi:Uma2 family endonuclease